MKKITIKRNSSLINLCVTYSIFLDNEEIKKIKNGQNITLEISDNSNNLQFGIKNFKSDKINTTKLKDNSVIKIKSNNLALIALLIIIFYAGIQFLIILNILEFDYNYLILLLGLSIIIYVQIFNSDNFIQYTIEK